MNRFCYVSSILPGKTDAVIEHWQNKTSSHDADPTFWPNLRMTGFECWIQTTKNGDYLVYCLEATGSLTRIFAGLRDQIAHGNSMAKYLQAYYLDVLGKDYSDPAIEPKIECLQDMQLPRGVGPLEKKCFFFPLLPHKIEAHRQFRLDATTKYKARHIESMKAFGVSRLTVWLQKEYLVIYTEREKVGLADTAEERIARGKNSMAWQEIGAILMDHTGLTLPDFSPDIVHIS